jgi:hypothetical protein
MKRFKSTFSCIVMATAVALGLAPTPVATQEPLDVAVRSTEKVLELGAFEDPVLAFSRIADLAQGPEGNLYVVQPMEGEVTVISYAGELVRRIGRRGQGPGEFRSPAAVGFLADTVWVLDLAQRCVSFFLDSTVVRTETYRSVDPPEGLRITAQLPLASGRSLVATYGPAAESGRPGLYSLPLLVAGPEDRAPDTLALLRGSAPLRIRRGNLRTSPLFHDLALFDVAPDGESVTVVERLYSSRGVNRIEVSRIGLSGDTLRSRQLDTKAVPLTDREWEARLDWRYERLPDSRFGRAEYSAAQVRPSHYPAATALEVGSDDTTWIRLEEVIESATVRWLVLDEALEPIYEVRLPAQFSVRDVRRDRVLGTIPGEYDIPLIQVYDIVGSSQDDQGP